MPISIAKPLLNNITELTGVEVRPLREVPQDVQQEALGRILPGHKSAAEFGVDGLRYIGCHYGEPTTSMLIAGPYIVPGDGIQGVPVLEHTIVQRLRRAMESSAEGMAAIAEQQRQRVEVASQFELMSSAIIAITGELSLKNVLNRIVDLARSVAGARYAALGVPGPDGTLHSFITSGITPEQHEAIGELPSGRGLLGVLLNEKRSMRLRDISEHPDSVGFPANHPPMHSFLGVPIMARGEVLGNLYLTEKRFADEFTTEDEQLVELLARHAAVAIENARLYQEVESQQERLRFVIDQLPEAVLLVEADPERVTLANQQASKLLGWDITESITLDEFLHENLRFYPNGAPMEESDIPIVRSLRFGETIPRREIGLKRPNGEQRTLLVNSAPLRQADGAITAAAIVFQDITQLKDAEQLKDDFLSLVSHELRTPLTTIHGGSHLLKESGLKLEEETRIAILDDIFNESRRLASLVENMVQLANIRAGRFEINAEPVNVRLLIQRSLKSIDRQAAEREFRIGDTRNHLASGDVESLDQVLRNLVQNSVKYAPADSPIEIESEIRGEMVVISVRDYGPGVDPSDLPLLFDRFQRGKDKETTAGMGLGLYLSRMIVEAHGGELWLELPEGGGSRFLFSVPKVRE